MVLRFDKTLLLVSSGFFLVIAAMITLLAIAMDRMQDNIDQIDQITYIQSKKTRLANEMLSAARERTLHMMKMIAHQDPFFRDEEMIKFNKQGGVFANARMQLLEMKLLPTERAILEEQGKLTRNVVPLQRKIVSLILDEDSPDSLQLLINQAIPMQDQVFDVLARLQTIQKEQADQSFNDALKAYQNAVISMNLLASVAFVSCLLIAFYVIRHTGNARRQLMQEKKRAQITLHSIGDGVITTDKQGMIEHMNKEAEALTGWKSKQAVGKTVDRVCHIKQDGDSDRFINPLETVLATGEVLHSRGDTLIQRKDKEEFAIEFSAAPIYTVEGRLDGTILVFKNVTEMRLLTHKLSHQATHDALTGLMNRMDFEQQAKLLLEEARTNDKQHALVYLDLDQFKVINDTCGHVAGDELLKQMSHFLSGHLRDSDILARLGGDEFGIIFRDCNINKAEVIMETIREALQDQRFHWEEKAFPMNVSAGLVAMNRRSGSLYELYSTADTACYIAKDRGRNRIHVYTEDDIALSKRTGEMQWVHRINRALEDDSFVIYYQTIAPLGSNVAFSEFTCELLVRMTGKDGKLIPPMAFIPAAERYNLMTSIDRWVVNRALDILSEARPEIENRHCRFSINLSAQSLSDDKFLEYLQQQFASYSISPDKFCFEITETAAIANLTAARTFMSSLHDMGCKFSLDDFGSGLSSFEYLRSLPVDFLKIDGAFVRNISNDLIDRAMVQSINQVGHVMGISTIAEFVEDDKTMELLKKMGINYAQGFAIGEPQPLETIGQPLKKTLNSI